MKDVRYIHDELTHNMVEPNIIVPIIMELFSPKCVVDFGCGLGTWLNAFKNYGVKEILGLDGEWYNEELLFKYIDKSEFLVVDLEERIKLDKKFDLVISIEVAEHLSELSSDIFVESLVNAGDVILFSAAIPGQGGFKHINEQWPTYWEEKFKRYGFNFYDVIRDKIWDQKEIDTCYRQNMFVVSKLEFHHLCTDTSIKNIVHPDLFIDKDNYINVVESGNRGVTYYFPLLIKSLINKFK